MMTPELTQFIKNTEGKAIDVDGVAADTGQCLQLVSKYVRDILKAPIFYTPGAADWWNDFRGSVLESHFDQIPVKKGAKIGDIAVFGASPLINSPRYGHIDIVIGDISDRGFTGFDSNWGGVKTSAGYPAAHDVYHTYVDVLGFLRLKRSSAPIAHPQYYNVVRGDTVTSICLRFHIAMTDSFALFRKLNPQIKDINIIKIGERIRIK